MNVCVEWTRRFNDGRTRAILAGGQAVVLHRLAAISGGRDAPEAADLLPTDMPGGLS